MFLLELLDGLYTLYLILIDGPLTIARWIRRMRHPMAVERTVAGTPEMKSFRRGAWFAGLCWLALSVFAGVGMRSFWGGVIVALLGFMFLPSMIEKRYERLVADLGTSKTP